MPNTMAKYIAIMAMSTGCSRMRRCVALARFGVSDHIMSKGMESARFMKNPFTSDEWRVTSDEQAACSTPYSNCQGLRLTACHSSLVTGHWLLLFRPCLAVPRVVSIPPFLYLFWRQRVGFAEQQCQVHGFGNILKHHRRLQRRTRCGPPGKSAV